MGSLNKAMVIGNLGRDPEVRYTASGQAVASLNVATHERWSDKDGNPQERTEWHRVTVWGKQGENCGKFVGEVIQRMKAFKTDPPKGFNIALRVGKIASNVVNVARYCKAQEADRDDHYGDVPEIDRHDHAVDEHSGRPQPDVLERAPQKFKDICFACHQVGGQGGNVGPSLDGVSKRLTPDFLRKWIADPQSVKPGTIMPNLGTKGQELEDLITYLGTL